MKMMVLLLDHLLVWQKLQNITKYIIALLQDVSKEKLNIAQKFVGDIFMAIHLKYLLYKFMI